MSKRRCGSGGTLTTQRRSTSGSRPGSGRISCALLDEPVDRAGAQRLVHAGVGLLEPGVELQLVVELVREAPARLEVRLQVALQPLDAALVERRRLRPILSVSSELSV